MLSFEINMEKDLPGAIIFIFGMALVKRGVS
jgi:hypothetical protein